VAADPVEVAALAYLLRPPDWVTTLRTAVGAIEAERGSSGTDQAVNRLREQLDRLRAELADARAKHRGQTAALKAENAELRRSVAAEHKQLTQAEQTADAAGRDQRLTVEAFERQAASVQSEQRRLRARVSELEAQLLNHRQVDRKQRGNEAVRARLLLDTLVDAARGLRQELALPPVVTLPADTVGRLSVDLDGTQAAGRALGPDDPALLQHLISVPRAHLLVDGYNVTKSAWPTIPLDAQRSRLLRELAPIASRSGAEVTVVFDGADLEHRPRVASPRGVRVRFSRPGVTADEVLLDLLRVEPVGRPLVVVSSDGEVAVGATRAGARPVPSATLVQLMGRGSRAVGGAS